MENSSQQILKINDNKLDEIKENSSQPDVKNINDSILNGIKEKYAEYVNNTIYVYKKCKDDLIVILEKLSYSRTNEERAVFNPNYAKYRADELKVVYIFNINDLSKHNISISMYDLNFTYIIGKIVYASYDTQSFVCSTGIHYFKTIDAAYYYNLDIEYWRYDVTL